MIKRFVVVALVIAVASVLAGVMGAHPAVVLAIIGGSVIGLATNLVPEKARQSSFSLVAVIAIIVTGLGGMIQADGGQFTLLGIFLGLAIGGPIGYFFGKEQ